MVVGYHHFRKPPYLLLHYTFHFERMYAFEVIAIVTVWTLGPARPGFLLQLYLQVSK